MALFRWKYNQMRLKTIMIFLVGCILTAGCALERSSRDWFANIEGMPYFARDLQKLPLEKVFYSTEQGWREYELGRRLENGIGIEKDNKCAAYWYYISSISEYDEIDTINPGYDANKMAYTIKYYGVPHARNALKRMKASGKTNDAEINSFLSDMISRNDKCYNSMKSLVER